MKDPPVYPPPIHWFARFLALILALLGIGMVLFAAWALIFDPKGSRWELAGIFPIGLLFGGVSGWIAVLGRVGPKLDMNLDALAPAVPLTVRVWTGAICILSPLLLSLLIRQHSFDLRGWYGWFNAILTALCGVYVFVILARMCISGRWPESTLRFSRRANMTLREQLAETRREHEHRRKF